MEAASRTSSLVSGSRKGRSWSFTGKSEKPIATPLTKEEKKKIKEFEKERKKRRMKSKTDPTAAMTEEEPFAASQTKSSGLGHLQHRDIYGNLIQEPDLSNPTRSRWERPLETIKAFEAAIENDDRHGLDYDKPGNRDSIYTTGGLDLTSIKRHNPRNGAVESWSGSIGGGGSTRSSIFRNQSGHGPMVGMDDGYMSPPNPYPSSYHHPVLHQRPSRRNFDMVNGYSPERTPPPPPPLLTSDDSSNLSLSSASGSNPALRESDPALGSQRQSLTPPMSRGSPLYPDDGGHHYPTANPRPMISSPLGSSEPMVPTLTRRGNFGPGQMNGHGHRGPPPHNGYNNGYDDMYGPGPSNRRPSNRSIPNQNYDGYYYDSPPQRGPQGRPMQGPQDGYYNGPPQQRRRPPRSATVPNQQFPSRSSSSAQNGGQQQNYNHFNNFDQGDEYDQYYSRPAVSHDRQNSRSLPSTEQYYARASQNREQEPMVNASQYFESWEDGQQNGYAGQNGQNGGQNGYERSGNGNGYIENGQQENYPQQQRSQPQQQRQQSQPMQSPPPTRVQPEQVRQEEPGPQAQPQPPSQQPQQQSQSQQQASQKGLLRKQNSNRTPALTKKDSNPPLPTIEQKSSGKRWSLFKKKSN